jgi:hypothetical protein
VLFFALQAQASESAFRRIELPHSIALQVPAHWKVLSQATISNLKAFEEATTEAAGIRDPKRSKNTLLAMNSLPDPTGAMIRVSISTPPDFTADELKATTAADIVELQSEMLSLFRQFEATGGPKVLETQPARVERLGGEMSLVIPYRRASQFGPSPWHVTQYKIPIRNHLVEITLSYRESDGAVWKPILEKVRRSITF